ncbi:MAG: hypothetical protein JXB40_01965 [Candidatus Omnitrophica bacterium]|nr:hypothetical protein [Candidatus Omnitrophota bacterium]
MRRWINFIIVVLLMFGITYAAAAAADGDLRWDDAAQWSTNADSGCFVKVNGFTGENDDGLRIDYRLKPEGGWVALSKVVIGRIDQDTPVKFLIKASSSDDIEMKFVDVDSSIFGKKVALNRYGRWTEVVIYPGNTDHWWGGDDNLDQIVTFEIAVSGKGSGRIFIDEIGTGKTGTEASFVQGGPALDPDRELAGIGFRQRRASEMMAEDPLVVEYLKVMQDRSSPDRKLVPSMEDNMAQTFNNSIVAMAFILKGERERAERILDFYANATRVNNDDLYLQNFFYKGQPRGFYQFVFLNDQPGTAAYHNSGDSDRWIGDMAWLLIAYKYYEKEYGSDRYGKIIGLIKDLLKFYYKEEGGGGYIQHGWRRGDSKLHEDYGHPEANIDCYAALKLCGEDEYAGKIKKWIDENVKGNSLALDNYTWRVLAFGKDYEGLLNIPEYDFRYRKTMDHKGARVAGFFHGPDIEMENIWVDGTGHMACAFMEVGQLERGYFYANQMDPIIFDRYFSGKRTRALPYTLNKAGGYDWVDTSKGFVSCAAWYIFAKNRFNPMTLEKN